MQYKNMSKKKTLGVQVTTKEYDQIESLAAAETRTISSYLRHVLYSQNILPRCSDTIPSSRKKLPVRRKLSVA